MDRSAAIGLASQPPGRPKLDNSTARAAPPISARRTPNSIRTKVSSSSLSPQAPISANQFIALAREAMQNALEENQTKLAEAKSVSNELKPRVTIDLSHKQIQRFPDEVVDIIKNELERLALSHNQISVFPSKFSECKSLRYLNVRNNLIREFPQCICELVSLEILDIGRNKLKILPPQLVKLTSLKVLSVQKNRIEILPYFLADMASLQVLKLDENPIRFPPKEVLQPQMTSPLTGFSHDNDFDEPAVTLHIKKYLKQKQISDRSEQEAGAAESSEGGTETLRQIKRIVSGRFPIKVNGNEVPDIRSPAMIRPPPIPSRSHYRGLSQQNSALRRPGVLPLTIGSTHKRLRSNSDIILQPQREQRVFNQLRRMGIIPKKSFDLDTVNEARSNRYSHYRGLSYGSAIIGNQSSGASNFKSPASPSDPLIHRATYVRRLSSLPERKRESVSPDPDVEAAKSILYALFQVHPIIQSLLGVTRDVNSKRTSLERVFYNATTHVEELDKTIQEFMMPIEEEEEEATTTQSSENVHHACVTCVNAYIHVLNLLQSNVDSLIDNGDPRYVRSLLLLLYGSTCEIYAAHTNFLKSGRSEPQTKSADTPKLLEEASDKSKTRGNPNIVTRHIPALGSMGRSFSTNQAPSNIVNPLQTNPLSSANVGRAVTFASATLRDAFGSHGKSGSQNRKADFTEEDRILDKITLKLQQSLEMTMRSMPSVYNHFLAAAKINNHQSNPDHSKKLWQTLIQKWLLVAQSAETLKRQMSILKSKEPGFRNQGAFWELCYCYIQAFTEMVVKVKEAKNKTTLLNNDIIVLLRPLQKIIKETSHLIQSSPWSFMACPPSNGINGSFLTRPNNQACIPTNALGPTMVPTGYVSHMNTVTGNHEVPLGSMLNCSVFERADALLSINNSVTSSRNTTMTSATLASVGSNDGTMTPSSITSPMNSFSSKYIGTPKVILS